MKQFETRKNFSYPYRLKPLQKLKRNLPIRRDFQTPGIELKGKIIKNKINNLNKK